MKKWAAAWGDGIKRLLPSPSVGLARHWANLLAPLVVFIRGKQSADNGRAGEIKQKDDDPMTYQDRYFDFFKIKNERSTLSDLAMTTKDMVVWTLCRLSPSTPFGRCARRPNSGRPAFRKYFVSHN